MKTIDPRTGKQVYRKRRRRYNRPGEARELTFSCYRRYRFFTRERVRRWFLEALQRAGQEQPFDLWAYVVMPEHVHLLIYPRTADGSISKILRVIKEPVARTAIDYLRQHAPDWLLRLRVQEGDRVRHRFWQPGGGYDRNVVELATVHRAIDYLHANPVRRCLVERAQNWQWSSARWYAGIRPVAIEMDRTIPMEMDQRSA